MRTRRANSVLPRAERTYRVLIAAALVIATALAVLPLSGGPTVGAGALPAMLADRPGTDGPLAGLAGTASEVTPLISILPSPSVVIALPNGAVDPGARFTVAAIVQDGFPGQILYRWSDTLGDTGTDRTLSVTAPRSGTIGIGVEITDVFGQVGTANATIGVGQSPSLAVASATPATDLGLPIPISIDVGGGEPPYLLVWQALPTGPAESLSMSGAATVDASVVSDTAGFLWVRATVTDGYSISTSIQAAVATVHPSPALVVAPVARDVDVGSVAEVTGLVTGGTPPFQWTAVATLPSVNVTGSTGIAGSSETVHWAGRFTAPGNSTVDVQVVDAVGVPVAATVTIQVFPALASSLVVETTAPAAGAPLNLSVYPTGGVPPYDYSIVLSDTERVSGMLAVSGPLSWTAHPTTPGYLVVRFAVSDAVYGSGGAVLTVTIGPAVDPPAVPPSSPPPGNTAPQPPVATTNGGTSGLSEAATAGVGIAALAALVLFALWRRRTKVPTSSSAPNSPAWETVRRLIEESGGTARSTLKLLAEEEGVGPADFDGALSHWETEGRIRVETDADGGPVVYWKASASSPTPLPKPSEGG